MMMTSGMRKLVLFLHVTSSVALLGAVGCFLLLSILGLVNQDVQLIRTCYVVLNPLTEWIILPLVVVALAIGVISALATPWGLLRHYWVLAKLFLNAVTLTVLLLQMNAIAELSSIAATRALTDADMGLRMRMIIHSGGGLAVLLLIMALSVWKPRGVTPIGQA